MKPDQAPKLELPQLAVYKYKHIGRVALSYQRKKWFVISLLVSMLVAKLFFPIGALAVLLPVIVYLGGVRTLIVGPRYIVCGENIVYYGVVKSFELSVPKGTLSLQTARGKPFVIDRDRFLKGRRDGQVIKDPALLFDEVSARVIESVKRLSPVLVASDDPAAP
jgi:hypothetical protein